MKQTNAVAKSRPQKIHALTSLRFFAAFYVVLYHTLYLPFGNQTAGTVVEQVISIGYVSVSFFFLLSGYILATVYLRNDAPVRKRAFYAARFARIYPLFLVTLLADTPYIFLSRVQMYGWSGAVTKTGATLVAHIVMLQAWLPGLRGIDQPNWSLSVETPFYLIFPFIGPMLWRLRGIKLWLTAAALWIASQIAVALVAPHVSLSTAKFHPLLHVGTFALGILLARWQLLQRETHGRSPRRASTTAIALLLALAGFIAIIHWENHIPVPSLSTGLLSPVFALAIWACSGSESWPSRLLSSSWLVILGEASFGLYLIHIPVNHLFEVMHWEHSKILYPLYLALCIGLSVVSFYWIETPSRKWLLRLMQTRPKESMEVASDAQ